MINRCAVDVAGLWGCVSISLGAAMQQHDTAHFTCSRIDMLCQSSMLLKLSRNQSVGSNTYHRTNRAADVTGALHDEPVMTKHDILSCRHGQANMMKQL